MSIKQEIGRTLSSAGFKQTINQNDKPILVAPKAEEAHTLKGKTLEEIEYSADARAKELIIVAGLFRNDPLVVSVF